METETKTETEIEFRRCSTIGFEHIGRGHETSNTGSLWSKEKIKIHCEVLWVLHSKSKRKGSSSPVAFRRLSGAQRTEPGAGGGNVSVSLRP